MNFANYRDAEQDTGFTWLNGEHIYSKTLYTSSLPNNDQILIPTGISNLNLIVEMRGVAIGTAAQIPLPYLPGGADPISVYSYAVEIAYLVSSNSVRVKTGADRSAFEGYITLYYTKSS